MPDSKRAVLRCLPKNILLELSQAFAFKGWHVLNKGEIIDRLAGEESITLDQLLARLKVHSLKSICQDLGVEANGSKEELVEGILSRVGSPTPEPVKEPRVPRQPKKEPQVSANGNDIEKRLWSAADKLWANTGLKPSEFSTPVLGLIFLGLVMHFVSVKKSWCDRICHRYVLNIKYMYAM